MLLINTMYKYNHMKATEATNIIRLVIDGRLPWMERKSQLNLIKPIIDDIESTLRRDCEG